MQMQVQKQVQVQVQEEVPNYHGSLRMLHDEKFVVLQPATPSSDKLDSLSFDLSTGVIKQSKLQPISSTHTEVLGLVGAFRLQYGVAVVVITDAEQAATVSGIPIYRVTGTRVLSTPTKNHDDDRLVRLLQDAVDPTGSGRSLYFAYGADLTLNTQRAASAFADPALSSKQLWERADKRFFWNRQLAKPIIEAGGNAFVLTMVLGFVKEIPPMPLGGSQSGTTAHIVLIARRSIYRAGTRHWRRGADTEGNAANFVESEQILTLAGKTKAVASFVQVRGSIPLLWTQIPNIKYKPPTRIAGKQYSSPAFQKHFDQMLTQYKAVVAINLVNQHGSEGKLAEAFRQEAELVAASHPPGTVQYVPFDFHKECGASRYDRLSLLWDQIDPFFRQHSCFLVEDGKVKTQQVGVCRTNCIDCLDRTNVVQSVLARKALETALRDAGVLASTVSLGTAFPELEQQFKYTWADHGDAISNQYAGTGALKAGFTRTGKRSMAGFVDDGVKSLVRYYLNNFQDGRKQDAVDLVTGTFQVQPGARLPFKSSPSPFLPLLVAVVAFLFAMSQLGQTGRVQGGFKATAGHLLQAVLLPLSLAVGLVGMVVKNGKHLVNKPQLCPELAYTVDPPGGK